MTTATPCVLGCRNHDGNPYPAASGQLACHTCATELGRVLDDIAHLYAAIDDPNALTPVSDGSRGAPGYGPRSPAVDVFLAHTDPRSLPTDDIPAPALAIVESWARAIREDRSLDTPPSMVRGTVPAGRVTMSRELQTIRFHWHYVLTQDWLPDFAREMRDVHNGLRRGTRDTVPALRIGTCPTIIDMSDPDAPLVDIVCGTPLRVRVGDTEIRCRGCGAEWTRDRWHLLGSAWADYATLAEQLGIPVGTLRRWAHEDGWQTTGTRSRRLVSRADALTSYAQRRSNTTTAA